MRLSEEQIEVLNQELAIKATKEKLGTVMQAVLGANVCRVSNIEGLPKEFTKRLNIPAEKLDEEGAEILLEAVSNAISILSGVEIGCVSNDRARKIFMLSGNKELPELISPNELIETVLGGVDSDNEEGIEEDDFLGEVGEKVDFAEDESDYSEEENEESDSSDVEDIKADKAKILEYYASLYNGIINNLITNYSAMYSSGYELDRPAGILTGEGLAKISGNQAVYADKSIVIKVIQEAIYNVIPFMQYDVRAISKIADILYQHFNSDQTLVYFPYKMLEYAYGLCRPGANEDSLNTYKKHSSANSWSNYVDDELSKSVRDLVEGITYGFVYNSMQALGENDYTDSEIGDGLREFLVYVENCLSLSIMLPKYKVSKTKNGPEVSVINIRVCDPTQTLIKGGEGGGVYDIMPYIISNAFAGSAGKDPHSEAPRLDEHSPYVIEFAHEFNHAMNQATPLFAYKALESVKNQGEELSWNNMILGQNSKGSIVKAISGGAGDGIHLDKELTHFIMAGSRAGKGVMTLNILASGIATGKNIFYLDRKPDMASLLKHLAPNGFVLNGGGYQSTYDTFNLWGPDCTDAYCNIVPDDALEAFKAKPTWNELGDLFYMRAMKLVVGIIMLRGSVEDLSQLGGEEGIVGVFDEFTNFQVQYMAIVDKLKTSVPSSMQEDALAKVEAGKLSEATYSKYYTDAGYYALSYLNMMLEDIRYLQEKKNAGFSPLEFGRSDVFVIGQNLNYGEFDYEEFREAVTMEGRRRQIEAKGVVKGAWSTGTQSIGFNIARFKGADIFFGRNDTGYLAAGNSNSKANGKLDDKASNFAYLDSFTEGTRKKLISGKESENLAIAEQCRYFKPFLILNTSNPQDECVIGMFDRVQKNAKITPDELIAENPDYEDPSRINRAIGFEDYIEFAGGVDVASVMSKASVIANHVVQDILGYSGDWMQFVCDLNPQAMFTIADIVEAGTTGDCGMFHPESNPIVKEYYEFNPSRFGGISSAGDFEGENGYASSMSSFINDETEDYSDEDEMKKKEDEYFRDVVFGPEDNSLDEEELDDFMDSELDIFGDMSVEVQNTEAEELNQQYKENMRNQYSSAVEEAEALINRLRELGVNVGIANSNGRVMPVAEEPYAPEPERAFGRNESRAEIPVNTLDESILKDPNKVMDYIKKFLTQNIVKTYGGFTNIHSFGINGKTIVINGNAYRCKLSNRSTMYLPYEDRRLINSGNIAPYVYIGEILKRCNNLSSIMVSSKDQEIMALLNLPTPDEIKEMDADSANNMIRESILEYFKMISSLKKFQYDGKTVHVGKYDEDLDEICKKYHKVTRNNYIGNTIQNACFTGAGKSWGCVKKSATQRKGIKRVAGVGAGLVGAAVSGGAGVGVAAGRGIIKGAKGFAGGVKNLLNN